MKKNLERHALSGEFANFRDLLGQISLPANIPMLGARQRWQMLVELLLGHAMVRGGRTRDFPFSEQRLLSAELSLRLASHRQPFKPGKNQAAITSFSSYDLIVSLLLVETGKSTFLENGVDTERHFSVAMMVLTELLFSPAECETVLNLLGVSVEGTESTKPIRNNYDRESLKLAKILASLANTEVPPEHQRNPEAFLIDYYDLADRDVEQMRNIRVSLIYLKTKKIQTFLDRCTLPFIQRGASYWCSQVSSRVRDIISRLNDDRSALLIDSDAITILACPVGVETQNLVDEVSRFFKDHLNPDQLSETVVRQFYPRLVPYYLAAKKEGHSTLNVLPALGLEVRTNKSLFSLVTDRHTDDLDDVYTESQSILELAKSPLESTTTTCSGRTGDLRLSEKEYNLPIWYNSNGTQGYGWASIVFSLAGLTYNRLTNESLQDILLTRKGLSVKAVRTQKELLQKVGNGAKCVSYLKFDGDKIGQRFSGIPLLLRPSLSLKLESLMRQAWLDGLTAVIEDLSLTYIPADLLYFGGDDLLAVFPENTCDLFIKAFDDALVALQDNSLPVTFTYAVISDTPLASTIGRVDSASDELISPRVIHQVNELLNRAKSLRRGKPENEELRWLQNVAGLSIGIEQFLVSPAD